MYGREHVVSLHVLNTVRHPVSHARHSRWAQHGARCWGGAKSTPGPASVLLKLTEGWRRGRRNFPIAPCVSAVFGSAGQCEGVAEESHLPWGLGKPAQESFCVCVSAPNSRVCPCQLLGVSVPALPQKASSPAPRPPSKRPSPGEKWTRAHSASRSLRYVAAAERGHPRDRTDEGGRAPSLGKRGLHTCSPSAATGNPC